MAQCRITCRILGNGYKLEQLRLPNLVLTLEKEALNREALVRRKQVDNACFSPQPGALAVGGTEVVDPLVDVVLDAIRRPVVDNLVANDPVRAGPSDRNGRRLCKLHRLGGEVAFRASETLLLFRSFTKVS